MVTISKWKEKSYDYLQTSWNKIFEFPFKCTQESKLHVHWLQYQILYRIVHTNNYLFNINQQNHKMIVLNVRSRFFMPKMNKIIDKSV